MKLLDNKFLRNKVVFPSESTQNNFILELTKPDNLQALRNEKWELFKQ